ncbi:hypothetical protein LEP1GSC203_2834 [Leptospira terpstrae serovar Hualin str. LT 11-33 = ATCC 700639]|uniref:Uncharacterized protein n=1 Tax=Leptospira terpstrae serovar Hualin str. LT 11-33 = ATCC 700639 TaxID=1257025 RepID=N1VXQ0_9LEPT|nr:hypothetical protein LEP1GSC203_2834 [Leptospira terpstrae serovar Hualin str. LT 11-33 = ATCC 700639]
MVVVTRQRISHFNKFKLGGRLPIGYGTYILTKRTGPSAPIFLFRERISARVPGALPLLVF